MDNYLTINDCIKQNIIELSSRQIKRRTQQILNDVNDSRVIYQVRKGIKTIVIMLDYAITICRNRKPKTLKATTNDIETNYNNGLIKTEITIHFNQELNVEGIRNIVRFYKSLFPVAYVSEGIDRNKQHLHMTVTESIEDAKKLICQSLEINDIKLKDVNVKISPIISSSKIIKYLKKFELYGTFLMFKNFSFSLLTTQYLNRCDSYIELNSNKKSIISPYGKDYFITEVFKALLK